MRIIARGSAPTRRAWPISASPRKINSFWRRRERSCAKWLPDPDKACWRGTSDVAISFAKQLIQAIHLKAIDQSEVHMPLTTVEKRATFHKMHEAGCFVLPNPYDIGSARALQHLGFKAIASTSAGFAWSIGKADNRVTLEDVLQHLTALCGAVDLPVNADFEGGFAHEAEKLAAI